MISNGRIEQVLHVYSNTRLIVSQTDLNVERLLFSLAFCNVFFLKKVVNPGTQFRVLKPNVTILDVPFWIRWCTFSLTFECQQNKSYMSARGPHWGGGWPLPVTTDRISGSVKPDPHPSSPGQGRLRMGKDSWPSNRQKRWQRRDFFLNKTSWR